MTHNEFFVRFVNIEAVEQEGFFEGYLEITKLYEKGLEEAAEIAAKAFLKKYDVK